MGYRLGDIMKLILISLLFTFNVKASLPPTQSRGANESGYGTTFKFNWGTLPITRNGTEITFGTLPVSGGGTGLTSFNQYALLSGSGTAINQIPAGASGTILFGSSTFPTFRFLNNTDVVSALGFSPTQSGTVVQTVSATAPIQLTGSASNPVISLQTSGVTSGVSYTKVFVDGFGRVTSGTFLAASDIPNLDFSKISTGIVAITSGGTGASSTAVAFNNLSPLTTSGDLLYHNGVSSTRLAIGTAGQVLAVSGVVPAWAAVPTSSLNVVTTSVSYTATLSNDLILASGTVTITLPSAASQTGKVLTIQKASTVSAAVVTISTSPSTERIATVSNTYLFDNYETLKIYSNGTGWIPERTERETRVKISTCSASPCTITSSYGGIQSVSRTAQGNYAVNTRNNVWAATGTCSVTGFISGQAGNVQNGRATDNCVSLTSCETTITNTAGANQDGFFHMLCKGQIYP